MKNRWARKHDRCIKCGTTEKKGKHIHEGNGLCRSCWDKKRRLNPKRIAYEKIRSRKNWEKFKQRPDYKEICRQKTKEWRDKNPNKEKAIWGKSNLKRRFIKFIEGRYKYSKYKYKRDKEGIKFYCEGCGKIIQTCILIPPTNSSAKYGTMGRELKIFKEMHKRFCKSKIRKSEFVRM